MNIIDVIKNKINALDIKFKMILIKKFRDINLNISNYSEKELLFKDKNGITFFEYIINNYNIDLFQQLKKIMYNINQKDVFIDMLVSNKCYDFIKVFNLTNSLIDRKDDEGYMIEKYMSNKDVFKKLVSFIDDKQVVVDICNRIGKKELTKDILGERYSKDFELTLSDEQNNISNRYKLNDINIQGPLDENDLFLLEELRKLFNNEDQNIVNLLIKSYTKALISNPEFVRRVIYTLIKIKNENMDKFHLYYDYETCYHSKEKNIYIKKTDFNSSILFHELGHLIHDFIDNGRTPEGYSELHFKDYSNINDKLNEFDSKYLTEVKKFFNNYYDDICKDFKFRFKNNFHEIDLPSDIIENVLRQYQDISNNYILKKHRKSLYNEFFSYYISNKYPFYMAISDIVDALYKGRLNRVIYTFGHPESYYYCSNNAFKEIVANFITILCSADADKYLDILRDFTSNEFVDYMNNYVNSLLVDCMAKKDNIQRVYLKR